MASHSELRPDDASLPLLMASAALSKAESRLTVATGTVVADNADGTQTWIGSNGSDDTNGVIKWVGDLSAPGRPLGLSAACSMQCVVVSWDGTLEGGVPSDFAYVEVFARREGSVDDVVSWGRLSSAGMLMSPRYDIGTVFDAYAIAYDDAHDSTGALARNRSEQSDLITVAVEQDADMEQIDAAVEEMSKKADEAGLKAEQVRKDMQSEVDDVRAKVDGLSGAGDRLSGQITDIKGTVNGQQTKLTEFGQKLEGEIARGDTTVKSVSELKQTVAGLSSTVSQTTKTASDALSKATAVEQTADGIKTTLSKDYTSTKDADRKYSTKTELTTEAGRIRAELSETTKTANGAMDNSTALETTVNGISTKISEQATTLNATVKTANEAKSTADSNKTTISQVSTTASDALSKATSLESGLDGFKTTVSQTYQTKADMSTYSTKTYVDETSKSVALGVVQGYKGADGSGLATKTDISVSRTEITSEVSGRYATKDGVSEEISSKITQNNSSWELKFATKTEAKSAQDAANTANAAAADAQSRVGNLEPCIRMTSDGVRVGKRSGDSFTGTSALVGTGGTFDILDEHGERMLEMSDTGLRLPVLKNNTAFKIGRYHHPTYDSDVVYIGDDYDSNVDSPARIEFNRNSINLTARLLNMNLTDSRFYVNGHPMGKASDIKQSQRWSNINMQAWNFGNLGIINILHPSGTNAHIMGNDNPTEIGRISPLNAPRDYVGCTLAAYGNTTLFAEVTPAGLVKCFTAFGGQHDWDYFTGTIVFPLTW